MSFITLTTDLGTKDHYVGSVKATILRQLKDVQIVDISHNIPPFNLRHAAFVIKNSYKEFPSGTIHIIGINAESDDKISHIAVFADGHYFICADNGLLSLVLDLKPDKIVDLNIMSDSDNKNFPTKDIFVKAACHIARGGTLELIGNTKEKFDIYNSNFQPLFDKDVIRGSVIHIDNYGNAITNIKKILIKDVAKGRSFKIFVGNKNYYIIDKIYNKYNQVPPGEAIAIFISTDLLSISLNQGSAANLMGISVNDILRIEFND